MSTLEDVEAEFLTWCDEGRDRTRARANLIAFPVRGIQSVVEITRGAASLLSAVLEGRESLIAEVAESCAEVREEYMKTIGEEVSADLAGLVAQLTAEGPARRLEVNMFELPELDELLSRVFRDWVDFQPGASSVLCMQKMMSKLIDLADGRDRWVGEFMTFAGRVKITCDAWLEASCSEGHLDRYYQAARTERRLTPKVGRNEPCSCGSDRKFKRCCGRPGA